MATSWPPRCPRCGAGSTNERIQLSVFRLSLIPGGTIFRLEFKAVSEAEAFARVFAGEVIADERTGAIAA
jgi:hypothetical protein